MVKARIGTISGTFLAPGVSKNKRLYTRENIAKAVTRMQARLADPNGTPITMLSHHAAGDDSTRIAARVTEVTLNPDGSARWSADIADTTAGRDIAALTTPDKPYLKNVSIRGWWLDEPRTENVDGLSCETADDLEVDGIDFTKTPGVTAARIDVASATETAERHLITESVEARLMTEATETETAYADPGYRTDGVKRLPLGTVSEVRAAWALAQTAEGYTPAQAKRIRGRIKEASKRLGINVITESAAVTAAVTEALEEAWASMSVDSGPGEVRVSGYTSDPSNLAAVGKKVAMAALAGLAALDPDNDGDIDLDGDDTVETTDAPAAPVAETDTKEALVGTETTTATTSAVPAPPKPLEQMNESELREYAVACQQVTETVETKVEPETATTETVEPKAEESVPVTKAELAEAVTAAVTAALAGKTTDEAATVEPEKSVEDRVTEAIASAKEAARKEILVETQRLIGRSGLRKGLVERDSSVEADKPLHEMSPEELHSHAVKVWDDQLPA